MTEHPDPAVLQEYLDGALDPERQSVLEAHLRVCQPCRQDLAGLSRLFAWIEAVPDEPLDRDLAPDVLRAISPLPRWVPSLAVGELLGALAILAGMVLGLGPGRILDGISAAAAQATGRLESAALQLEGLSKLPLEWSGQISSWSDIQLLELASAGVWAGLAASAFVLWFVGNGLVLGPLRRRVRG